MLENYNIIFEQMQKELTETKDELNRTHSIVDLQERELRKLSTLEERIGLVESESKRVKELDLQSPLMLFAINDIMNIKQDELMHPYLQEKISLGLLPHCQAMLLARHLRGDTEYYPPYLVK